MRLRYGFGLGGGMFIVPGLTTLGALRVNLHMGAQFNEVVAVYLAPRGELVIGKPAGVGIATAALVELTFNRLVSVGIGPEVGYYGGAKGGYGLHAPLYRPDGLVGGTIRVGWHPVYWHGSVETSTGQGKSTRFAATFDVRLLYGRGGVVTTLDPSGLFFAVLPSVTIGLEAY